MTKVVTSFKRLHGCFCILFIALIIFSCKEEPKHSEGKRLAEIHCATCHLFPEPEILPRKVWGEKIMPNMGLKMGMSHGPLYSYGDSESTKNLKPTLPQEDWNKIVHYYINTSESKTPTYPIQTIETSSIFKTYTYTYDSIPLVSMTTFDKTTGNLLLGDALSSSIVTINNSGDIIETEKFKSPPVKAITKDSLKYILTIGHLNPSDDAKGALKIGNSLIDSLIRPVDFLVKDIDKDGLDDIFVCNYGNAIGNFSIYKNNGSQNYSQEIIYPLSGSIKVEMTNIDDDANEEIVVLFAQEHEIFMVWDYENNTFTGKRVAQFQPAFGSVDFELKDMNMDGLKDIIVGNGDNSDFSTVLKNFHGIRVLLNMGNSEFKESYFYPMHGVSKLKVEDFDMDGDMDIMAISHFGDFTNTSFKSVQLLTNEGNLKFTPHQIKGLPDFRWQTMDVVDYDNDGDKDVFIGSFNLDIGPQESDISQKPKVAWIKLENLLK